MEAHAYRMAAQMKIKEGNALARLAAMSETRSKKKALSGAQMKAATDQGELTRTRGKLQGLIGRAKQALRNAKSKPFSKSALKRVVEFRAKVKGAKQKLIRLRNAENKDQKRVKVLRNAVKKQTRGPTKV